MVARPMQRGSYQAVTRAPDWQSDDGAISLYLGDCREVLPAFTGAIVVTDPPYGIGLANHAPGKERRAMDWTIAGDSSQEVGQGVLDWLAAHAFPVVAFASPKLPWRGDWRQFLAWSKGEQVGGGGDPATCWKMDWELIQVARTGPLAGRRDSAVLQYNAVTADYAWHPSPKPVALMAYLVGKVSRRGDLIGDPFMGAGSTAVACARFGRRFVGAELDAGHFNTTVRRVSAEIGRHPLFASAEAQLEFA